MSLLTLMAPLKTSWGTSTKKHGAGDRQHLEDKVTQRRASSGGAKRVELQFPACSARAPPVAAYGRGPGLGTSGRGFSHLGPRQKMKPAELETEHSDSMATLAQDWECGAVCPGDGGHEDVCESLSLLQIDTGWDSPKDLPVGCEMWSSEVSRLAAQIRRLYGSNKKAEKPFWICLTGFVPGSLVYDECFRMNDGFSNYLMDTTQESYLDLFPLETIVFLTPDSETVLEDVNSSKVYILGGLVDESIQKKLTLRKAQEHSLQTARLPIREYMVKNINEKNYHSEILAINQVFDTLSTYYETKSWPEALKAGVPLGKGYILPDADK
uniref:tRNA methyltransferase 10 homolog B n=1 Tax=Crocodylus porosus TaxID=8502 RepID=A0A7M4F1H4_CROPO